MSTLTVTTLNATTANTGNISTQNMTISGSLNVGNVLVLGVLGKQTLMLPAGAFTLRTSNGAAFSAIQTPVNKIMIPTLDFEAGNNEYAQALVQMPKSWNNGNVWSEISWVHHSNTLPSNVVFGLSAGAISLGENFDITLGTEKVLATAGGTGNVMYKTTLTEMDIGGPPASNDFVVYQLRRITDNAGDDLNSYVRVVGVKILYTINSLTDE